MEGLLILAVLAAVLYTALWLLTRRSRRRLERALSTVEQRLNVAQARLRAAEEHAATVRTRTLGWDQPTRDGMALRAAADPVVLEPVRTAEQIMADFPPPPEIPSWRRSAEPVRVPELAEQEEAPEPSPLYEQIAATVPVTELDAELLVPPYVEPAAMELSDAYDVEPTPAEDVPQDEARVTGLHRGDDDEEPPPGPLDDDTSDGPRINETAPLAVVAVCRYDWSHARQRPVGPLHWGRGLMHAVDEVRARIYFAPRVWVTHIRPAAVGPLARIRLAVADWWATVGPDRSQTWRGGELHRVMGGGISADVHAIVRHRRRGGVWQVAA